MNIYEKFPQFEAPRDLEEGEIEAIVEPIIWAAATHFWGTDFCEPEARYGHGRQEVYVDSEDFYHSDDKPHKVDLGFYVEVDDLLIDDDEEDEEAPPNIYVGVDFKSYHHDITKIFQKKSGRKEEVWEVVNYEFYLDGTPPLATRYYAFRTDDKEIEPDDLSHRHHDFLERISERPPFNPTRSSELSTQDAIDIKNILLALETPAKIIAPSWDD